jgi:hypothetical protein
MTASGLRFREISEAVNIAQHKMLISARQPWFYHLAIKLRCRSGFSRSNSAPGILDGRFRLRAPRQPRTAIAASDAMKRTTIVISKKVNVPRVNTFKAAAIAP